jgi:hypothetical protein
MPYKLMSYAPVGDEPDGHIPELNHGMVASVPHTGYKCLSSVEIAFCIHAIFFIFAVLLVRTFAGFPVPLCAADLIFTLIASPASSFDHAKQVGW